MSLRLTHTKVKTMNMSSMMGVGGGRMPDFSAMKEKMFTKADANKDNEISFEEFQKAGKNMPTGKSGSADKTKEAFSKIDTDSNGTISKDEMSSFGDKMSSQMQDMMLSLQAMMSSKGGGSSGPDINAMFGEADSDKSGGLSRAEFDKAGANNPIAKLLQQNSNGDDAFAKIDTDGDGSLSKDEMKSFAETMKKQMSEMMAGNGSSQADFLQAQNAYSQGGSKDKNDLTQTLLKMLDGNKTQGTNRDARA
jgi:Ca2+-binding EF-hand superfamily protein